MEHPKFNYFLTKTERLKFKLQKTTLKNSKNVYATLEIKLTNK